MTFFQNKPPAHSEVSEAMDDASHSLRSEPLFKQDTLLAETLSGQHISLSAYISKHLQDNATSAQPVKKSPVIPGKRFMLNSPVQTETDQERPQGQYLNSLDVEMGGGLEQFLPTPLFRLRVSKKRLDQEIAELTSHLSRYKRLPQQSPAMRQRIMTINARLAVLKTHEAKINAELASAFASGSFWYEMTAFSDKLKDNIAQQINQVQAIFKRLFYGEVYLERESRQYELQAIQELLSARLQERTPADVEISQLLMRYDLITQQLQKTPRPSPFSKLLSLPQRLWQEAIRLVK